MTPEPQRAVLQDVTLNYYDIPVQGEQTGIILLLHGFASSARVNWIGTGWASFLTEKGYRVIAHDHRGHGGSSKFYDPSDYGPDLFASDALALLDHLGITRCDVMGYSMGARVTAWLCHEAPERVRRAVFGGMGAHIYGGRGGYEAIAAALEAEEPDAASYPVSHSFRAFADRTGSDRLALAACIRPSKRNITPLLVKDITTPVLIAVGTKDDVAGSPHELAAQMKSAIAFDIDGLDHMKATGAESYKNRVATFLGGGK